MTIPISSRLKSLIKRVPVLGRAARWGYLKAWQSGSWLKWRRLEGADRIWLELGSGPRKGSNGWTSVDVLGADINYDLRKGIPLRDSCVDRIYMSHLLEHIPYPALRGFVGECMRVLKKGGTLSVCVPDAERYIRAYMEHRQFRDPGSFYPPAAVATGSFLDQVNYIAYMGGEHHYLFDRENLVNTLRQGGFQDVVLREFDPAIDLANRDFESIYAVARK